MKYSITGNVDFFKELQEIQNSIDNNDNNDNNNNDNNTCLLTGDKLLPDAVELQCGHKFNYSPLFAEVVLQKCTVLPKNIASSDAVSYYNTSLNLETTKLNYNQVKCPYCRTITPYLLPYYPYPDVCKVKYVNVPTNLALTGVSCEYEKFISAGETDEIDDIFIDERNSCRALCMYNEKYDLVLCNKHLIKLDTSGNKVTRQTRLNATSKIKKKTKANVDDENVIISHHNPATTVCSFILLSGPRKGCSCEKPMWVPKLDTLNVGYVSTNVAYCKAHYNKGVASK